jgi:hypothetical protein
MPGAVDGDEAAVRNDPLRTRMTKRNAYAHNGVRVVPADKIDHDVSLLSAQPGAFLSGRTAGVVGRGRPRYEDRVRRGEDAPLAK